MLFLLLLGVVRANAQDEGTFYISDAGNFGNPPWQILRFQADGSGGRVFINHHLSWPQDILFVEADTTVLVSNLNTGRLSRFHADTGSFIDEFATGIIGPTRMAIGPDGGLYVLQWSGNGRVLRYDLDSGSRSDFTSVGVTNSIGMDWDAAGNLYVSSYDGRSVRKFGSDGTDMGLFVNSNLAGPTNIWFADNGDLLVVDYLGNSIKRFDTTGQYVGVFVSNLPQGEGVAFLPNGQIAVGSGGTASVRIYDNNGTFVRNLVPPGTLGLLNPNAVVYRPSVVSTTEDGLAHLQEIDLFVPNVGKVFHLTEVQLLLDTSAAVFDAAGKRVADIPAALGGAIWDASVLPSGIYYVVFTLRDGRHGRQKIIVQ